MKTWTRKNIKYKLDLFTEISEMTVLEYKEYRLSSGLDLPSLFAIINVYGTWNNFKKEVY